MARVLKLNIEEIFIPYGVPWKGRLFGGVPSRAKPRAMSPEEWSCCVADLALNDAGWERSVAIPLSFWPQAKRYELTRKYNEENLNCLSFVDEPGQLSEQQYETPAGSGSGSRASVMDIIEMLKQGENVLVLSTTSAVSGFLPAVVTMAAHPSCHFLKVLYPIASGSGYTLTPEQIAYLAGLADARRYGSV